VKKSLEALALLLLLVLGLAPRLFFISRLPIIPVSDFHTQVEFAQHLHEHGLTSHIWYWDHYNPGFPLVLSLLFYLFPSQDPVAVARFATTFLGGLLPMLPFLIWRGVLPLWVRMLAGISLALWPGHVLFSGAVTQDSWVIFPSVALAVLAVRSLISREPHPLPAGMLYAAAVAMRQEMLIVLFPLLLVAALGGFSIRWRRVVAASLAAGLPLLALASFRYASSGRFSLRSPNSGQSILGSYVPGATTNGWIDPYAYFASVRPDLVSDRYAFFANCQSVALQEALHRPAFHAARILSSVFSAALGGEAGGLYWTLGHPGGLPVAFRERGDALYSLVIAPLMWEMAAIQTLFLGSLLIGLARRRVTILVLASTVLLKYGLHGITVMQGRYVFVASALEILTIVIAIYEIRTMVPPMGRWPVARALAVGMVFGVGLFLYAPRLAAVVNSHDIYPQRTYRFVLQPWGTENRNIALSCVVDRGALLSLGWPLATYDIWSATIRTLQQNPTPGEKTVAECELTGKAESRQPLTLQILNSKSGGGPPAHMIQRVELDGVEVLSQEIPAEPSNRWINIPLGIVGAGTKRKIVIEVTALQPAPGAEGGEATVTEFRTIQSSSTPHLAMAKPATQSSTLSGYGTTSARVAVDGETNGNFSIGSVSHTNLESNAWWQVDLGASAPIGSIVIWNRTDCCSVRLHDYWVFVSNTPFSPTDTPASLKNRAGTWSSHQTAVPNPSNKITTAGASGRYVRVQLGGTDYLSLAEVQVFGPLMVQVGIPGASVVH
jgi:hypothetical protein